MTGGMFLIKKESKERGFIAISTPPPPPPQKRARLDERENGVHERQPPPKPQERSSAGNISAHCATSASWLKSVGTEHVSCSYGSLLDVEIETKRVCLHQVEVTYFGNQSVLVRIELWKHDYFTHQFSFMKTSYLISQKCHPHVRLSRTLAHVMKQRSSAHNGLIVLSD